MMKKLLSHAIALLLGMLIAASHFMPNWAEIGTSINNFIKEAANNPWGKSTAESLELELGEVKRVTADIFATQQLVISRQYETTYLKILKTKEDHSIAVTFYFAYAQSEGLPSIASDKNDSIPLTQKIDGDKIVIDYQRESFLCPYTVDAVKTENEQLESFWTTLVHPAALYDSAAFSNVRTQALIEEDVPNVARRLARSIEEEYISQLQQLENADTIIVNGHSVSEWQETYYVWYSEEEEPLSHEGEGDASFSVTYDSQGYQNFIAEAEAFSKENIS